MRSNQTFLTCNDYDYHTCRSGILTQSHVLVDCDSRRNGSSGELNTHIDSLVQISVGGAVHLKVDQLDFNSMVLQYSKERKLNTVYTSKGF